MSMFDYYRPLPAVTCSNCGGTLADLRGRDGPCQLLVFEQGSLEPLDQTREPTFRLTHDEFVRYRLPERFEFGCTCETCGARVEATGGTTADGRWDWTVLGRQRHKPMTAAVYLDEGLRQCSVCSNVWVEERDRIVSVCPECEALTEIEAETTP